MKTYKQITEIAYNFLLAQEISTIPVDVFQICKDLELKVLPLSELKRNFADKQVFDMWNNKDGALTWYVDEKQNFDFCIGYNDLKPDARIRFTIAEELSHYILKHFLVKELDKETYYNFEIEARLCAATILIPTPVYCAMAYWGDTQMQHFFDVSQDCAIARKDSIAKNLYDFTQTKLYTEVENQFNDVICSINQGNIPECSKKYYLKQRLSRNENFQLVKQTYNKHAWKDSYLEFNIARALVDAISDIEEDYSKNK
ncbi:MAG: ImmA/IrrE family metallo-endopeptidase [Firmicutes bacterium]|nr:ImmA/IrrE family metallo-endopeptidase [Bacillota bacterium]